MSERQLTAEVPCPFCDTVGIYPYVLKLKQKLTCSFCGKQFHLTVMVQRPQKKSLSLMGGFSKP